MGFSVPAGDGQACLGLLSALPGKGRELKGYRVNSLKDELTDDRNLSEFNYFFAFHPSCSH